MSTMGSLCGIRDLMSWKQKGFPSALYKRRVRVQVKAGKKPAWQLGVADPKLGSAIQETTGVPCVCNEMTGELLRGVRAHEARLLKQFLASTTGSVEQGLHVSQLSLAHAYSRSKVRLSAVPSHAVYWPPRLWGFTLVVCFGTCLLGPSILDFCNCIVS
jgi:hypothetical protein